MRLSRVNDREYVVMWQGYAYWFSSLAEAQGFMQKVEDSFLYQ